MSEAARLDSGLSAEVRHRVRAEDLATAWRGDVPALASPVLFWLAEMAAMQAIAGRLPPGQVSVGAGADLKHLAPTPEGDEVVVTATLAVVSGGGLLFKIAGHDGQEPVVKGVHQRSLVDVAAFDARLRDKAARLAAGGA